MTVSNKNIDANGALKRKQSSPIKHAKIIGPLTSRIDRQHIAQQIIVGDMAEDVDECDDEDDEQI